MASELNAKPITSELSAMIGPGMSPAPIGIAPIPFTPGALEGKVPETQKLVSDSILRIIGLNSQFFSGSQNPSGIYRLMVQNYPTVYPYYREIEEKDTAICSALAMRRLLVLARDAAVQAADDTNGQAQMYADGAAEFLAGIPKFDFCLWELLDAPAYGYAVVEIMWKNDGSKISVDKVIGRPQELFRFGRLYWPQTNDLLMAASVGGEGFQVPQQKFLVSTYQPRHGDRRGIPLMRRLFWPSWFKRNVLPMHLRYLEKGPGTVIVKYPTGADNAEKKLAYQTAEAIATELAVAVPDTLALYDAALKETRTRDASDYTSLIDYMDAEMTRMILGQTLTTHGAEQQRGSMALGDIHLEMMYQIIRADAQDIEDVINEQLLGPWLLWTYGPQALDLAVRPWWTIEKDPPKDASAGMDLLEKVHSMVDIPKSIVYETGQVPMPDGNEPVVSAAATPASLFSPASVFPKPAPAPVKDDSGTSDGENES